MDQAKKAVQDFMSKSGHHDTTVHEKVAPAVVHETIQRTQHEEVQTAIDKEVHQDHYHTSVQPVMDSAVLPEQHHHNIIPVEHRSFEHDNAKEVEARLAAEQAKFTDEQQRVKGETTSSMNPIVAGEHIHHHVHETIQPVVNKQTIEPHVVHTTVPIHEVHHNAAQHHSTSALPAVSMADFKNQGGVLSGREERYDGFQGEPRSVGGALGGGSSETSQMGASGLQGRSTDAYGSNTSGTTGGLGQTSSGGLESGTSRSGHHFGTTDGPARGSAGADEYVADNYGSGTGTKKAGLMDKMNPKIDADGDGKAGFMK